MVVSSSCVMPPSEADRMVCGVGRQLSVHVDIFSANAMSFYSKMCRASRSLIGWAAV